MNKIFLGIITSLFIFNMSNFSKDKLVTEDDIFYSLIEVSQGEILQTSVKVIYYVEESLEMEIKRIEEYFQGYKISFSKDVNNISILNIIKDETSIEIKGIDLKDKLQITIKATVYGDEKKLRELEQLLQEYTKNKEVEAKYYKYMKGKLRNKKIDNVLQSINNTLVQEGFGSIETLEIDNGYTSVAALNSYLLRDEININYSLCSYETSTYIFIGTPIIDEIY